MGGIYAKCLFHVYCFYLLTVGSYLDVHVLYSMASFVFFSPWRILVISYILFLNEVRIIMRLFNQDTLI